MIKAAFFLIMTLFLTGCPEEDCDQTSNPHDYDRIETICDTTRKSSCEETACGDVCQLTIREYCYENHYCRGRLVNSPYSSY